MNCPRCSTPIPPPADLTQRTAPCPGCGVAVDLAAGAGADATAARPPPAPAAPAGDDPWIGRSFAAGRYTIESLLGAGGMGRVYRARQTALGRAVAVKILSPELARDEGFRRRFEREAGTLAALEHPRIVTIHDVGVEGDVPYIVMALVVGSKGVPVSLRDLLDAGPVEEELALRIIQETCAALEYAHGKGVIHRDIKPGNILLDAEGHAKIADFGIARVAGASDAAHLTTTGAVLGTMRYMAPEQLADAARVDARSDLYSLGVVFYEMLTGQAPVGRFELPSEVRAGLDHRLDAIVDRALRRAATQRYASAAEMARDLSRITTEREYGRMQGADAAAAGAAGTKGAKGATGSGGGGGRPPAASHAASTAPSTRPHAGAPPAVPPSPVGPHRPESPASSTPAARRSPASSRRLVVGSAVAVALLGAGIAVFFVTRPSSSTPKSTLVGKGGTGTEPARPTPAPAPAPSPTPTPTPPGKQDPPAMETPPAAMDPVPPAMDTPPAMATYPAPPAMESPPPPSAAAEAEKRRLEDARKQILDLHATDALDEAAFDALERTLPKSGSLFDRHAAQKALEAQLSLWKAGRFAEVVAALPQPVVARALREMKITAAQFRESAIQVLEDTPLGTWRMRRLLSVGPDFVLAVYDAIPDDPEGDDGIETRVAVALREGGAWKAFP